MLPESVEFIRAEICFLQLRFICELIALACLAAHGEVRGARSGDVAKFSEADKIVNALEQLHPDFYPKPYVQLGKDASGVHRWSMLASGFLTKPELVQLWRVCGANLHRGTFKAAYFRRSPRPNLASVQDWADKIWMLLNAHKIHTVDPDVQLHCLMKPTDLKGPQFVWFRRRADGDWAVDGDFRL